MAAERCLGVISIRNETGSPLVKIDYFLLHQLAGSILRRVFLQKRKDDPESGFDLPAGMQYAVVTTKHILKCRKVQKDSPLTLDELGVTRLVMMMLCQWFGRFFKGSVLTPCC